MSQNAAGRGRKIQPLPVKKGGFRKMGEGFKRKA